jgi:hypothetical protein
MPKTLEDAADSELTFTNTTSADGWLVKRLQLAVQQLLFSLVETLPVLIDKLMPDTFGKTFLVLEKCLDVPC